MTKRRRTWFLIRLAIYVAIVAVLWITRGPLDWARLRQLMGGGASAGRELVVAGRDLAPALVESLVERYAADYGPLTVRYTVGGTNQALEDLLNRRADVAFLYRPPSAAEQAQLAAVDGDTAIVVPVAVGGLAVIGGAAVDTTVRTLGDVASLICAGREAHGVPFYIPNPNDGTWDAAVARLPQAAGADHSVVFLADATEVLAAVATEPQAFGLVSTFAAGWPPHEPATVLPLRAGPDALAARPTFSKLVTGDYPLHHRLLIACRGRGDLEGGRLVTHLASARGQRQVLRIGAVPARQVAREIVITRDPPGS